LAPKRSTFQTARSGGLQDEKIVRCRRIFLRGGRVIEIKKARQVGARKGRNPIGRFLKTLWFIEFLAVRSEAGKDERGT